MIVAIHQPHYLPWLRYCDKIARADVFVALDDVEFNKNGWQNRNKVKGAAGPQVLTVPVRQRLGQRIHEVAIPPGQPWARKHLRTIEQAYARTPHLSTFREGLERIYAAQWDRLVDLNLEMLRWHLAALGIATPVVRSSELGVEGRATQRLVEIVRKVGGTTYLTGAYALQAYLDPAVMRAAGVRLLLHEWKSPEYAQAHPAAGFVPDLATLDLMVAEGPRAREILAVGGRVCEGAFP